MNNFTFSYYFFVYPSYIEKFLNMSDKLLEEGKIWRKYRKYYRKGVSMVVGFIINFFIAEINANLNKKIYNIHERNLLLRFYVTMTFLIVIFGLFFNC